MSWSPSLNAPGGRGVGDGSSPVTPAGTVNVNGKVAHARKDLAMINIQNGTAAISGGLNPELWAIANGEIVCQLRRGADDIDDRESEVHSSARTGAKEDIQTYVLSNTAGTGFKGETQHELNERINIAYVAKGRNNSTDQNDLVALQIGGMTTVRNTGPQTIEQGDLVIVSFPDPADPRPLGKAMGYPDGKVPFILLPFNDKMTMGSVANAYNLLTKKKMTEGDVAEYRKQYPMMYKFAQAMSRFSRGCALVGAATCMRLGMVEPVQRAQWKSKIVADAAFETWCEEAESALFSGESKVYTTLRQDVVKRVMARDSDQAFFAKTKSNFAGGPRGYENNHQASVVDEQVNLIPAVVAAVNEQHHHHRKRTLGVAQTTMTPGQDGDIFLKPC